MVKDIDRLSIGKEANDRAIYNKLENDIFEGKSRKEQFLFAMALGFKNDVRRSLKGKDGFFLAKDLGPIEESLINTIAIGATDSVDILANRSAVYEIAEEYAHGGIRILCGKVESTQFGSFYKQFEKELVEIYDGINLGGEDGKGSSN
jgi:hypothetical protein